MNVRAGALLLALGTAAWPQETSKKPITVEDLYRVDGPRAVVLSKDGTKAAFARAWIDPETRQDRSSLWLVDGSADKARALEAGEPDARSPLFSPDGRRIAFLSTRHRPKGWTPTPPVPPESDPATDLWVISADGGDAYLCKLANHCSGWNAG